MKLLLMVVPSEARNETEAILEEIGVSGFTEIPEVHGEGTTGPRFGSRTYPGTSSIVFTALDGESVPRIKREVAALEKRLGLAIHTFVVPLEG